MSANKDNKDNKNNKTIEDFLREAVKNLPSMHSPDGSCSTLIKDLQKEKQTPEVKMILYHAMRHEYDDYRSPWATPKIILHRDLIAAKLPHLAEKVLDGDYD